MRFVQFADERDDLRLIEFMTNGDRAFGEVCRPIGQRSVEVRIDGGWLEAYWTVRPRIRRASVVLPAPPLVATV